MLILSDTHAGDLKDVPFPKADVVLHCGDLTNDSRSAEFEKSLAMLRTIDAPLKLVIPGNHDYSLEQGYWEGRYAHSLADSLLQEGNSRDLHSRTANVEPLENNVESDEDIRTSWDLIHRAARDDNIFLLPQGLHALAIPTRSGPARLRLFASPMTRRCDNWAFQYDRSIPYRWGIPPMTPGGDPAVDVVMTHGPSLGIRDGTGMRRTGDKRSGAGCAGLLSAVERARPRLHCFGHIHEAWGAETITWRREVHASGQDWGSDAPTYGNLVDARKSRVLASLLPFNDSWTIGQGTLKSPPPARDQEPPRMDGGCCTLDISLDGEHVIKPLVQTLCVNAAIGLRPAPWRGMPLLVEMDLPSADEDDASAAMEVKCRQLS